MGPRSVLVPTRDVRGGTRGDRGEVGGGRRDANASVDVACDDDELVAYVRAVSAELAPLGALLLPGGHGDKIAVRSKAADELMAALNKLVPAAHVGDGGGRRTRPA
jgi:hypothetical protein